MDVRCEERWPAHDLLVARAADGVEREPKPAVPAACAHGLKQQTSLPSYIPQVRATSTHVTAAAARRFTLDGGSGGHRAHTRTRRIPVVRRRCPRLLLLLLVIFGVCAVCVQLARRLAKVSEQARVATGAALSVGSHCRSHRHCRLSS